MEDYDFLQMVALEVQVFTFAVKQVKKKGTSGFCIQVALEPQTK